MKSVAMLVSGFIVLLAVVSVGRAAETPNAAAPPATQPAAPAANVIDPATWRDVRGSLVRVDGKDLVISTRGGEVTVPTDVTTLFDVDNARGKLEDLKERMSVRVTLFPATVRSPVRLQVSAMSPRLRGTLVRLAGRNVIVLVSNPDGASSEVSIPTNDQTKITAIVVTADGESRPSRSIRLEDLVGGMRLSILPETGTAKSIVVLSQAVSAARSGVTQPTAAEEQTRGGLRMLAGPYQTVLKIEEGSITVKLFPTDTEGDKRVTVAISQERTKVRIGEVTEEKKNEDGTISQRIARKDGKLADVKVGERVKVTVDDEGAREIRILPAPPMRE